MWTVAASVKGKPTVKERSFNCRLDQRELAELRSPVPVESRVNCRSEPLKFRPAKHGLAHAGEASEREQRECEKFNVWRPELGD